MKSLRKVLLVIGILGAVVLLGVLIFPCLEHSRIESRIDRYTDIIEKYAKEYDISAELIKSVIGVESKGIPDVVSHKGAIGLMQVMPPTMKDVMARFNIPEGDLKEPDFNIRIGTGYLRMLYDQFEGELWFVLTAYNAGPSRVRKWQAEMPGRSAKEVIEQRAFPETAEYVRRVLRR